VDWKDSRDGRTGKSQPLTQRVSKVVIVEEVKVRHAQSSARSVEVDLHGALPHGDHPKNVVAVNVHIVVVDLLNETGRSHRTGVKV